MVYEFYRIRFIFLSFTSRHLSYGTEASIHEPCKPTLWTIQTDQNGSLLLPQKISLQFKMPGGGIRAQNRVYIITIKQS